MDPLNRAFGEVMTEYEPLDLSKSDVRCELCRYWKRHNPQVIHGRCANQSGFTDEGYSCDSFKKMEK